MNSPEYSINPLVTQIEKGPEDFIRKDIIDFIIRNDIRIVNFRYVAADGRLKTLNIPVTDRQYLETVLSYGERVDGSSLFPFIEAGSSDLYIIPRFSTAYADPFAVTPTLGLLCSYFTKDGLPFEMAPEYTLRKAHESFTEKTGFRFEAMGELEFYITDKDTNQFNTASQKGYHESAPFSKFETFRTHAIQLMAKTGGMVKYGHAEVGNFSLDGKIYEQNEIEFLVNPVEKAADQLVMAKWILRTLAWQYGLDITFAPKITSGKAGSGLHFHTRIMKGEQSAMMENGVLSNAARTVIAGYMKCATALTAFGNTIPTSYFRLVPHQEAPTNVCWGDHNRSVLVRVPLGWNGHSNMILQVNPLESGLPENRNLQNSIDKQTVEFRSADGSADIYYMLAGLMVAARTGFEMPDALEAAARTYVNRNIHEQEDNLNTLEQLPASCHESALVLEQQRKLFEAHNIFTPELIDGTISALNAYGDKDIRREIQENPGLMMALVRKYYYCG